MGDDPEFSRYHDEAELLLEAYLQDTRNIMTALDLMRYEIESMGKLVTMELGVARNRLLRAEVVISVLTLGMAFASVVVGAFGMNLRSGLESKDNWFFGIFVSTVVTAVLVPLLFLIVLQRHTRTTNGAFL